MLAAEEVLAVACIHHAMLLHMACTLCFDDAQVQVLV